MSGSSGYDPHAEYRRQAAEHFGTAASAAPVQPVVPVPQNTAPRLPARPAPAPETPPAPSAAPRIFRAPGTAPDLAAAPTTPVPAGDPTAPVPAAGPTMPDLAAAPTTRVQSPAAPPGRRFGAGTTYGGSGRPMTGPPPAPAAAPPPPPPPPPQFAPPLPPPPQWAPPPPQWAPPPSAPPAGGASGLGLIFDLKPYHVLRGLIVLWVVLALFTLPGIGFWLSAVATGVAEWYVRTNNMGWPADLHDFLAGRRLAAPAAIRPVAATPPIPFRPLTFPELYRGALKVVARNWPSLIGIPFLILTGFLAVFALIVYAVMQVMFNAATSTAGTGFLVSAGPSANPLAAMLVMMLVFVGLLYALALPADALLLALSVIASDKAVRGEPVRFGEVFRSAKGRMFPILRLTMAFYGIGIAAEFVIYLAAMMGALVNPVFMLLLPVSFLGVFVFGVLFSLSPIVCVTENLGVMESFRRSLALCRPAWGRILGVHLLWAVCVTPLVLLGGFILMNPVLWLVAFAALVGYVRCLQMLIYTDLRIRQENLDRELLDDWTRNMRKQGLDTA